MNIVSRLSEVVKDCPDFPRKGILFKDIMPIFQDPGLVRDTCQSLVNQISGIGKPDVIVGIEARGFLIGPIMAQQLNVPFVPIRKTGKLPRECHSVRYEKEYGFDEFDIQIDALKAGDKAVIVDDLLATGGTLEAAKMLCDKSKAEVMAHCVIFELEFLNGRDKLNDTPVISLVKYN